MPLEIVEGHYFPNTLFNKSVTRAAGFRTQPKFPVICVIGNNAILRFRLKIGYFRFIYRVIHYFAFFFHMAGKELPPANSIMIDF